MCFANYYFFKINTRDYLTDVVMLYNMHKHNQQYRNHETGG